jgi:hypothetical protein
MTSIVAYLYVGCRDPGFVVTVAKEQELKLKATHCDFSDLSVNQHLSPKNNVLSNTPSSRRVTGETSMHSPKSSLSAMKTPIMQSFGEMKSTHEIANEGEDNTPAVLEEIEEYNITEEVVAEAYEVGGGDSPGKTQDPPVNLIVERRYCTACNLEQPLRAKHCKDCKYCVALHDHHCPWLGICIGERNRRSFYWYLIAQTAELWWAGVRVLSLMEAATGVTEWFEVNIVRLALLLVVSFFTLMLSCLLMFHTYLACSNRTTCKW